jgi:hypothetical protein
MPASDAEAFVDAAVMAPVVARGETMIIPPKGPPSNVLVTLELHNAPQTANPLTGLPPIARPANGAATPEIEAEPSGPSPQVAM